MQQWQSGQRVITSRGDVATVAFVEPGGQVWAWVVGRALPVRVTPRCDALGGEHDGALRNAA